MLKTAEQALRASDGPKHINIQHFPDKLKGSGFYSIFFVLGYVAGYYNFDMSAIQQGNDVKTHLYIGHSSQSISPIMIQSSPSMISSVNVGKPFEEKEAYEMLFTQIEALLQKDKKKWLTCEKVKNAISEKGGSTSVYDPLCSMPIDIQIV